MIGLRGDVRSLADFQRDLKRIAKDRGQRFANSVATAAAPAITKFAKRSFDNSQTPYGVPWEPGAEGQKVTLRKSGALEQRLVYRAIGTIIRVALGVPYAKYQIGKRPVFPRQGGNLPGDYLLALQRAAVDAAREFFR